MTPKGPINRRRSGSQRERGATRLGVFGHGGVPVAVTTLLGLLDDRMRTVGSNRQKRIPAIAQGHQSARVNLSLTGPSEEQYEVSQYPIGALNLG